MKRLGHDAAELKFESKTYMGKCHCSTKDKLMGLFRLRIPHSFLNNFSRQSTAPVILAFAK